MKVPNIGVFISFFFNFSMKFISPLVQSGDIGFIKNSFVNKSGSIWLAIVTKVFDKCDATTVVSSFITFLIKELIS